MKTALIMGISGGFGGHVAQALAINGWKIKIMMRQPEKLPARFKGTEVIKGEVANIEHVRKAAEGVDSIIYGVSPANYAWEGVALPLLENVASVAEEKRLTIVFPGNVYVYDPADGPEYSELSPMHPVTPKGVIRHEMESRLQRASERGAKIIILRMGDFIGKDAKSTWIEQMIKKSKKGYMLTATGPQTVKHSWAYLPDAATTVVKLLQRKNELEAFSVFNFKGYQLSINEMAEAVQLATGKSVVIKKLPWFLFKIFSPFSVLFKGLLEMRYLWDKEINLKDDKLRAVLQGNIHQTALSEALIESGLLN